MKMNVFLMSFQVSRLNDLSEVSLISPLVSLFFGQSGHTTVILMVILVQNNGHIGPFWK